MRNRLFICFLLTCLLLYYGVPQLSFQIDSLKGIFSFAWFGFALMVLAGNLVGILYAPKRNQKARNDTNKKTKGRPERLRQYQ
jgi:hypothetical protein